MFHYGYMMPNTYGFNYSFPFYAPEGSQSIYVMVPIRNPTILNNFIQSSDNTENLYTEEEILPDFRCKVCLISIPNYSEFQVHLQTHNTNANETLNKSNSSEIYPLEMYGEHCNYTSVSNALNEINNSVISPYYEIKSPFISENNIINEVFNNANTPEILPKQTLKDCTNSMLVSKLLGSFNNVAISTCPELRTQNSAKIDNHITGKEIFSAFICPMCSIMIPDYTEFKDHLGMHNKSAKTFDALSKSHPSETYLVRAPVIHNYSSAPGVSCKINDTAVSHYAEFKSNLDAEDKNVNTAFNKTHSSDILSRGVLEKSKNHISAFTTIEGFNNSAISYSPKSQATECKTIDAVFNEKYLLENVRNSNDCTTSFKLLNNVNSSAIATFSESKDISEMKKKSTNVVYNEVSSSEISPREKLNNCNDYTPALKLVSSETNNVSFPMFKYRLEPQNGSADLVFHVQDLTKVCPVKTCTKDVPSKLIRSGYEYGCKKALMSSTNSQSKVNSDTRSINTNVLFNKTNSSIGHPSQTFNKLNNYMLKSKFLVDMATAGSSNSQAEARLEAQIKNTNLEVNVSNSSKVCPVQIFNKHDGYTVVPKPYSDATTGALTSSKSEVCLETQSINANVAVNELHSSEVCRLQTFNKLNGYIPKSMLFENESETAISSTSKFKAQIGMHNKKIYKAFNECRSSNVNRVQIPMKFKKVISILKPLTYFKENNLHCSYCPKVFKFRFQLNKHLVGHREMKDLTCVLCKSTFSDISSLRKHLLMFHSKNKDRRECPYCDYRCFQTSDLDKHIARRHTRDFKYKCCYCIKGFATPKELNNHLRRKHLSIKAVIEAACNGER